MDDNPRTLIGRMDDCLDRMDIALAGMRRTNLEMIALLLRPTKNPRVG